MKYVYWPGDARAHDETEPVPPKAWYRRTIRDGNYTDNTPWECAICYKTMGDRDFDLPSATNYVARHNPLECAVYLARRKEA